MHLLFLMNKKIKIGKLGTDVSLIDFFMNDYRLDRFCSLNRFRLKSIEEF